jgi:hypothetical protein
MSNKRTRFASLAKILRDPDGLLEVNGRQNDHKLVSALSPEYRGPASNRLFEHLCEVFESAVGSLVPISIIEVSKGIDIASERGDRLSQALCFLKGRGCDGVEP